MAELLATEAARVAVPIEYRAHGAAGDARGSSCAWAAGPRRKDEVARAKFILVASQGPGAAEAVEEIYARETVLLNEYPRVVETLVQAIRIGDLGIAASPCETFVETGLAIKADSPLKPTFTIELANDYRGYLPTAEHHKLGGYETWRARSSFLEVEAEAKLRARSLSSWKQWPGAEADQRGALLRMARFAHRPTGRAGSCRPGPAELGSGTASYV